MKIILLLGRPQGGGTEAHASWLLGALNKVGFDTELHTLFPNNSFSYFVEGFYEALTLFSARNRFIRLVKIKQVDLVICFGRIANCCGYEIKRQIPGVSLIATCRTNRRLPTGYRKTLAVADLILTNSEWAKQRVLKIPGVKERNTHGMVNALLRPALGILSHNSSVKRQLKLSYGLDPYRPVVSMLAHFVNGKNQEGLIRLIADKMLPHGTQLLFAGSGPRLRYCQRVVKRLGLESEVRFLGRVVNPSEIFHISDLIVSTSLRDSVPNALVEAQAAGLPVIAYDLAGIGEVLLHKESGLLVPAESTEAMADAIRTLLENDEVRKRYGQRAREHALVHFDPNRVLEDYIRHILSLSGN